MTFLANVTVALVAGLHVGFLALEMIFWKLPLGRKVFRTTPEFAHSSAALAANQGLYNGFLAAGLVWGLCLPDRNHGRSVECFFLVCVLIAGMFGAATVSKRILFIQAFPAALALALLLL